MSRLATDGNNLIMLGFALSASVVFVIKWLASLAFILFVAPVMAIALLVLITNILKAKNMLRLPWSLLVWALLFKSMTWVLLAINWPSMASEEAWWPFTGNGYYLFEAIGTCLILVFSYLTTISEEKRLFSNGLIADCTLLFVACFIAAAIIYSDTILDYVSSLSWENAAVRLQILPGFYYVFVVISIVVILNFQLKIQLLHLLNMIPFAIHLGFEAYFNYYTLENSLSLQDQLYYAQWSATFYVIAGIFLIVHVLALSDSSSEQVKNVCPFRLSPLVWVASGAVLLVTPLALWVRPYFNPLPLPEDFEYVLAGIAGVAVFTRFAIMVSYAREQQTLLEAEITIDDLTAILNRRGFIQALDLYDYRRSSQGNELFCLLDVDTFKFINDTYGHHVGDDVLCYIARRIGMYEGVKLAGRLGGDEFILILAFTGSPSLALKKFHHYLSSWQIFGEHRIFVSVSVGGTFLTEDVPFSMLYTSADHALYQAKSNYSGESLANAGVYSEAVNTKSMLLLIQQALDQRELLINYQPIYDLRTNCLVGVEALMRLCDAQGTVYLPSQFIEMAKQHNKLFPLTQLLLKELVVVCQQLPTLRVAINLPPLFFEQATYRQQLVAAIEALQLPKERLLLEITEEPNSDIQKLAEGVQELQQQGYSFALDDFGTGSSSLSRLASIAVDVVKIDILLLRAAERGRAALIESATSLAHRLNATVVIEGIETLGQLEIARNINADMGQGFHLSRPLLLNDLLRLPQTGLSFPLSSQASAFPA